MPKLILCLPHRSSNLNLNLASVSQPFVPVMSYGGRFGGRNASVRSTEATKAYIIPYHSLAANPSPAMRLLRLHIYHISLPTLVLGAWPLMLG